MSTEATPIANYGHPTLQALIDRRGWRALSEYDRIGAAYAFVKDEVRFGYNRRDDLPASEVLADGYGQCNTKGNLLVALLRGLDVPARIHGYTIDKALQRGAIPELVFGLAPRRILHSMVEARYGGRWIPLEGLILDADYLSALQRRHPGAERFCGYGAATTCLASPDVEWRGQPTYIQKEGLRDDFGVFDSPDDLYAAHGTNLSGLRRWLFERVIRRWMNATVERIRAEGRARGAQEAPAQVR